MLSGTREKDTPKERSSSPREARSAPRSRKRLLRTSTGSRGAAHDGPSPASATERQRSGSVALREKQEPSRAMVTSDARRAER